MGLCAANMGYSIYSQFGSSPDGKKIYHGPWECIDTIK